MEPETTSRPGRPVIVSWPSDTKRIGGCEVSGQDSNEAVQNHLSKSSTTGDIKDRAERRTATDLPARRRGRHFPASVSGSRRHSLSGLAPPRPRCCSTSSQPEAVSETMAPPDSPLRRRPPHDPFFRLLPLPPPRRRRHTPRHRRCPRPRTRWWWRRTARRLRRWGAAWRPPRATAWATGSSGRAGTCNGAPPGSWRRAPWRRTPSIGSPHPIRSGSSPAERTARIASPLFLLLSVASFALPSSSSLLPLLLSSRRSNNSVKRYGFFTFSKDELSLSPS